MDNNTTNWSDGVNEENETWWSTNNDDLYTKMYEKFSKNKEDDQKFLDTLFENSDSELIKLKEFKNNTEEFKDLDDEKIKIKPIQFKYKWKYLDLKNTRKIVEEKIKRDYDVSDSFYTQKISSEIFKTPIIWLKGLLQPEKIDLFLENILKTNKPQKRPFTNLFNLFFKDLNLSNFWPEEQEDVKAIFAFLELNHPEGQLNKISDSDLFEICSLFRYLWVSKRIKRKFLETFNSQISITDYKSIFRIGNEELNDIKKKIVANDFPDFNNLDEFDQKNYISWLSDDNVFMDTNTLTDAQLDIFFSNETNVTKIWKLFQKDYNDQIDGLNKNTEDHILNESWIWDTEAWINADKIKEFFWELWEGVDFSKFAEWNIIELDIVQNFKNNKDNEDSSESQFKQFLRIEKIDLDNKIIKYYDIWSWWTYYPNKSWWLQTISFGEFLSFIKKWDKKEWLNVWSISFNTENDIQEKIKNEGISVFNNELIQEKNNDLTYEEAKKILIEQWVNENDITDEQIKWYISAENKRINTLNKESLLTSINKIDSDWKQFWLEKYTTFVAKDNKSYYTINDIDETTSTISLYTAGSNELEFVSFIDFNARFKELECKRKSKVSNLEELLINISDDIKVWKWFKLKDNKIVKKSTNNEKEWKSNNIEYNYLVTDNDKNFIKWRNVIRIESLDWDKATVTLWSIEEPDDAKKDNKNTVFWMEKSSINISLSVLESWMKKSKMRPESEDSHNDIEEQKYKSLDRKTNITSWFFSWTSFNEMIKGGEFWLESVKNYLEEWNEEHAARFAEKYLGKVLPKWIRLDLISRSEAAQKKRMEDYKQRFKDLDSKEATELVKRLLMNKNAPEPQKEAAMIFMMESYWSLYTKGALFPLRWNFLWYKAMWWEIWDELFVREHKKAADANVQFTEEDLIYVLVLHQCKKWYKPKRRGRLYKEIEALVWKWREEEFEKWKKDAEKKRTIDRRVDFAIEELEWWSYPNAMWAFEEIVWKWDDGNQTKLNKVPFVMAFSWLAYDFDQKMVDGFKNNPAKWLPVMSTMFMSVPSLIGVFSDAVLKLTEDLVKVYPDKFPNIHTDAKKIYDKQQDSTSQTQKVKDTVNFFDNYWEVLTRSMNMLMTWKTDDLSKTDQIILLNKDKQGYGAYKEYYNTFKSFIRNNTSLSNEDLLIDAFMSDDWNWTWSWIIWMDTYNVAKDTLVHVQWGWFRLTKAWPQIWKWFTYAIDEVVNTDYSALWNNDKIKKEIIKDKMRWLLAWLLVNHWSNANAIKWFMTWTSPFYMKFNEWWIVPWDFIDNNISADRLLDSWDNVASNLLDKYVNNVLHWKKDDNTSFSIPKVTEEVKWDVDWTIN